MPYVDLVPALAVAVLACAAAALAAAVSGRPGDPGGGRRAAILVLLAGAVAVTLVATLGSLAASGPPSPADAGRVVNLVPLRGIETTLRSGNLELSLLNIGGNIGLFLPVGFLGALAWPRARSHPFACIGAGIALSVGEEVAQFVLGRAADVDDVLLNGVGVALGVWAALALSRRVSGLTAPPARPRVTGR